MKIIELTTASGSLNEYARDLGDEFVVLTTDDRPVAAIVSLKHIDPESLALSTNREFLEIIGEARQEIAAGQTISLEAMKEQVGL